MPKIRLTKNEYKKQKDALKRYNRYLPTLMLKKQQLQIVIRRLEQEQLEMSEAKRILDNELMKWVELFAEDVNFASMLEIRSIQRSEGNIAGVDIPLFESIEIEEKEYDLFALPLWVDKAILKLNEIIKLDAQILVLNEQISLLNAELRSTAQRVNLFEKVKIPEAMEHIKKIRVYLGDQQTAAVVRGKTAKSNIEKVS